MNLPPPPTTILGACFRFPGTADAVPFASAQSEHPVAALATGEVVGAVFEAFGERPDLVFILVTRPHAGALDDIIATVDAVLHPLAMIGCAAESVVGTGREVEETLSISLWAGRVGPLLPVTLRAVRSADDSWEFSGWPEEVSFHPTALILVADPLTFPADQFLAWMEDAHPGLPVVGGNVSAALGPGGSRLVVGDRTLREGAVGVLIGSGVDIETVTSQGCRPYGRPLTVTKSDRNIMFEVAGTPAIESMVEQMKGGLSAEDIGRLENNGLHVGRLIDEHVEDPGPGDYLVRSVIGVDRSTGAMAIDDRIPLGSTVRFHLRDAESGRPRPQDHPHRPPRRWRPAVHLQRAGYPAVRRVASRRFGAVPPDRAGPGGPLRRPGRSGRLVAAISSTVSPPPSPCSPTGDRPVTHR